MSDSRCVSIYHVHMNEHACTCTCWQVGTKRNHGILITMHGKNICDSLAIIINSAIQWAIRNDKDIDAGTRALFLWLAIHKQAHRL